MRIAETKKDTYEFKRDIIIGAENPRSGKIMAEKMIRWGLGPFVVRQHDTRLSWAAWCAGGAMGVSGCCKGVLALMRRAWRLLLAHTL